MLALLLTAMMSVQAPDPHVEAERLARDGAYVEALDRFQELAVADPGDLEARIWIARLQVMLGRVGLGEDVYRSILIEAPDRLDALVGLGATLTTQGRFAEARRILTRAEQQAPDDLEVLAAQGRLNLMDDRYRLAAGYYGRATLIAPEQADLRLSFEEAHRRYDHRIEVAYFNEAFNTTTPDSRSGDVTINLRVNEQFRVYGRGQQERKFATTDARGGGGLDWRTGRRWLSVVQAHALAGPGNDILPRADTGFAVGWTGLKATGTIRARYFNFLNSELWAVGPALSIHAHDDLVVSASYTRTLTEFTGLADQIGHHAGDVRFDVRVHPRLWLGAGYARGIESFDRLTVDRLNGLSAHTYSGAARLDFRSFTSLAVTYEHQDVDDSDLAMNRVTARFIQGF
jgi:YaiO family outer membrane protein